ncbi:hypothetical protein Brsp05_04533 [Brucella sp. NBRC 12953]|uniref:hypothetical protein n=1 Tax=Brucella sp. NBRC 12953 TaxID=3075481 RepID=UPI0030A7CE16
MRGVALSQWGALMSATAYKNGEHDARRTIHLLEIRARQGRPSTLPNGNRVIASFTWK